MRETDRRCICAVPRDDGRHDPACYDAQELYAISDAISRRQDEGKPALPIGVRDRLHLPG